MHVDEGGPVLVAQHSQRFFHLPGREHPVERVIGEVDLDPFFSAGQTGTDGASA